LKSRDAKSQVLGCKIDAAMMAGLPEIQKVFWEGIMGNQVTSEQVELDQEWIELIFEAIDIGMTIEDVQAFLNNKHLKEKV